MSEEDYVYLDEVIQEHKDSLALADQQLVARAYVEKGMLQWWGDEDHEATFSKESAQQAFVSFDVVIEQYKDSQDAVLQTLAAKALFNKGQAYQVMNRQREMFDTYSELARCFKSSEEIEVQEYVAKALLAKGAVLGGMNQLDAELQAYNMLLMLYKDSQSDILDKTIARTLFNKGAALGAQGKADEAIMVFTTLIRRFERNNVSSIKQVVDVAKNKLRLYRQGI